MGRIHGISQVDSKMFEILTVTILSHPWGWAANKKCGLSVGTAVSLTLAGDGMGQGYVLQSNDKYDAEHRSGFTYSINETPNSGWFISFDDSNVSFVDHISSCSSFRYKGSSGPAFEFTVPGSGIYKNSMAWATGSGVAVQYSQHTLIAFSTTSPITTRSSTCPRYVTHTHSSTVYSTVIPLPSSTCSAAALHPATISYDDPSSTCIRNDKHRRPRFPDQRHVDHFNVLDAHVSQNHSCNIANCSRLYCLPLYYQWRICRTTVRC